MQIAEGLHEITKTMLGSKLKSTKTQTIEAVWYGVQSYEFMSDGGES